MDEKEYKKLIRGLNRKDNVESYFLDSVAGRKRSKYVLKMFKKLDKKSKILNVGDGTGTISLELENMGFKNITSIDIDKEFIKIAKKRCKHTKFVVANAENLPFKDEEFEVITYVDVIEFLDFKKTIKEASRVSKKGATIYFENFNKIVLKDIKKIPLLGNIVSSSNHYKTQSNFNAIKLIEKNKFKVLKFDYLNEHSKNSFKGSVLKVLFGISYVKKLISPISYFYLRKK